MKTPPMLRLPRNPEIVDPLTRYLWDFGCSCPRRLGMFFDMRYGFCSFPAPTTEDPIDYSELHLDDSTGLVINIEGTKYSIPWVGGWDQIFGITELDPNAVQRYGQDDTVTKAWNVYDSDPSYFLQDSYSVLYSCYLVRPTVYQASGRNHYVEFDTSLAQADGNYLTFQFTVTDILDYVAEGVEIFTPTLVLYQYDFGDSITSDDWTGGTLLGELEISTLGTKTISLDPDVINVGGNTRFRMTTKDCVDDNRHGEIAFAERFTFEAIQLKWGLA